MWMVDEFQIKLLLNKKVYSLYSHKVKWGIEWCSYVVT